MLAESFISFTTTPNQMLKTERRKNNIPDQQPSQHLPLNYQKELSLKKAFFLQSQGAFYIFKHNRSNQSHLSLCTSATAQLACSHCSTLTEKLLIQDFKKNTSSHVTKVGREAAIQRHSILLSHSLLLPHPQHEQNLKENI